MRMWQNCTKRRVKVTTGNQFHHLDSREVEVGFVLINVATACCTPAQVPVQLGEHPHLGRPFM